MNDELLRGDWSQHYTQSYYESGFNSFMQRPIGNSGAVAADQSLSSLPSSDNNVLNYDQMQVSGALGDKLQIGSIILDGSRGRISIYDEDGYEVVRLGELDE